MYQGKSSFRPFGECGGEGGGDIRGCVFVRARLAETRWALEDGTNQSGRVGGSVEYSCLV